MTEDNKAVEAPKVSKFTEKRNAAKATLKKYLDTKPTLTPEVMDAIKYMAGLGARSQGMVVSSALHDLLVIGKPVPLVDIFTKFEYGRPTMEKKVRDFIKASPENRIWVAFENGAYVLKGKGADAPRGWTGYLPTVKEEL